MLPRLARESHISRTLERPERPPVRAFAPALASSPSSRRLPNAALTELGTTDGRSVAIGQGATGSGRAGCIRDIKLRDFVLTPAEGDDVTEFLKALTDNGARDMSAFAPLAVPSGLTVDVIP